MGPTPRTTTLEGVSLPRRSRLTSTTISLDTRGAPPGPAAISGRVSTVLACWRSTPLTTSLSAPLRVTITFSGSPVATRVLRSPSSSISTLV